MIVLHTLQLSSSASILFFPLLETFSKTIKYLNNHTHLSTAIPSKSPIILLIFLLFFVFYFNPSSHTSLFFPGLSTSRHPVPWHESAKLENYMAFHPSLVPQFIHSVALMRVDSPTKTPTHERTQKNGTQKNAIRMSPRGMKSVIHFYMNRIMLRLRSHFPPFFFVFHCTHLAF